MVNAQEWLDKEYPLETRDEVKKLNISNKNLEGSLYLERFINLEILDCSNNEISILDTKGCSKIKDIYCLKNKITEFVNLGDCLELFKLDAAHNSVSDLDPLLNSLHLEKLKWFSVGENNVLERDLSCFSRFTNLETLYIGNPFSTMQNIRKNFFNHWRGSLKPLRTLTKLKDLWISDTDIEGGLEYLPENLERFEFQGTKFEDDLKPYNGNNIEKLQSWKKDFLIRILQEENTKIKSLEDEVQRLFTLIKDKKDRVIRAYLYSFTENEQMLLHELITTHLEYSKAKKQNLPSVKLKKDKEKFYNELEEKIGEEQMEKVEFILNDCEDLIHWDIELDEKISKRNEVIKESGKVIQKIVNNFNIDISGIIKVENGQYNHW